MQLWVPIAAAILGGIGAQLVSLLVAWNRARREQDAEVAVAEIAGAAQLRTELWNELASLRSELKAERERVDMLTKRLEESRSQYLTLAGQHAALSAEHVTLKAEHAELQEKYELVQLQLHAIRNTTP